MRVLIVEDDRELAESLARVLDESGMVAEIATNGREADFLGCTEKYDAAVLDLGLPELDGVSVLQHWREQGRRFPVLILTGRGRWSDKLSGFGAGADDYLTKPFMHEEVVLRLRALMRRAYGHGAQETEVEGAAVPLRARRRGIRAGGGSPGIRRAGSLDRGCAAQGRSIRGVGGDYSPAAWSSSPSWNWPAAPSPSPSSPGSRSAP